MPSVSVDLPYPPSVNRYWRHARGRWYIAEAGKAFRDACGVELLPRKGLFGVEMVQLTAVVIPPDARRRDLDNVLKALLDVLEYYQLFEDDYQVAQLSLYRRQPGPPAGVRCVIESLNLDNASNHVVAGRDSSESRCVTATGVHCVVMRSE